MRMRTIMGAKVPISRVMRILAKLIKTLAKLIQTRNQIKIRHSHKLHAFLCFKFLTLTNVPLQLIFKIKIKKLQTSPSNWPILSPIKKQDSFHILDHDDDEDEDDHDDDDEFCPATAKI